MLAYNALKEKNVIAMGPYRYTRGLPWLSSEHLLFKDEASGPDGDVLVSSEPRK